VLRSVLAACDAVVLTGGVSKGDHDHVPDAVRGAGAEVVFHRVRARPGQPTLGAVADGKPLLGLPGNPLSVLCAGRRLLGPALRRRAGFATADAPRPTVRVADWGEKCLPMWWWRPVTLASAGVAELAPMKGSGDVCGPATTDGFVEAPPDCDGSGPLSFFAWDL